MAYFKDLVTLHRRTQADILVEDQPRSPLDIVTVDLQRKLLKQTKYS